MQFSEVIGQEKVKSHLLQQVNKDAIPHAQLFLSSLGAGALPIALAFAQYIVCTNKSENDSCGVCAACVKASKLIHPDIHFTFPVIKKSGSNKPSLSNDYLPAFRNAVISNPYIDEISWLSTINDEAKQGNITADECRQIIKNLNLKSFESPYKIQIIWMAEALKKEGNILLKLLEEPTPNTVLILIAENQEAILSTIYSRCQIVKINAIDDAIVFEALKQKGVDEQKAERIAFLSNGNYSEALQLTEKEIDQDTLLLQEWFKHTIQFNTYALNKWIDNYSKMSRENIKTFFKYILHVLRETLQLNFNQSYKVRLNEEEFKIAKALLKYLDLDKFAEIEKLIDNKHYEIERNVNAKVALMDLSINVKRIISQK
ncbi:MAG: hypothetical protein H6553_13005 [Chitinophagales bacterium]|nr:hypothetical protein [Chitinophagales bacterium]